MYIFYDYFIVCGSLTISALSFNQRIKVRRVLFSEYGPCIRYSCLQYYSINSVQVRLLCFVSFGCSVLFQHLAFYQPSVRKLSATVITFFPSGHNDVC